jgi:hypothetical protein
VHTPLFVGKVWPYYLRSCPNERLTYTRPSISRLFAYQDLLKLGRERDGAILLDIGCCCKPLSISVLFMSYGHRLVGTDVRKAILDGFPLKNVVTTDLHKGRSHLPLV